jgi:hypothetical protein
MTTVDLRSSRLKLQRARHHRDELKRKIQTALDDRANWAILSAELDTSTGYHIFRIAYTPAYDELIEEFSVYVGDVAHGLRSSLDHLAWQLANSHGPMTESQKRRIQFPVHHDAGGFQNNGTASCFDPRDWTQMEGYQPFNGVNGRPDRWSGPYIHQLQQLQELSNTDKHRELCAVTLTSSQFRTIQIEGGHPPWLVEENGEWVLDETKFGEPDPYAAPPNFDHRSNDVEIGAEVARFKLTSDFAQQHTIEMAGVVVPSVTLADLRPIIPTLDRIATFVELVHDEFTVRLQKDGRA